MAKPFAIMMMAANAPAGGGGGGATVVAARVRSLTNGGSHRTTLATIAWLDGGGNEISHVGGTAFEGGAGSVNGPASNAYDGSDLTNWSRVSSFGACYNGMLYPALIVAPAGVRFVTDSTGSAATETPVTFLAEISTDTTDGTDGTWTTIYTSGTESWTSAQQTRTFTF